MTEKLKISKYTTEQSVLKISFISNRYHISLVEYLKGTEPSASWLEKVTRQFTKPPSRSRSRREGSLSLFLQNGVEILIAFFMLFVNCSTASSIFCSVSNYRIPSDLSCWNWILIWQSAHRIKVRVQYYGVVIRAHFMFYFYFGIEVKGL